MHVETDITPGSYVRTVDGMLHHVLAVELMVYIQPAGACCVPMIAVPEHHLTSVDPLQLELPVA